jgi:hypothetical protein
MRALALKGRTPAFGRRMAKVAALAAVVSLAAVFVAPPAQAANTIETAYGATGTWAVSTSTVTVGSDTFNLFYPTNLGAGGYDHPIITWANGTNATPANYPGLLNHLASWGFVVVAGTSTTTGTGAQALAGANYMVSQNTNASSIFFQNLNTAKVGAAGHSQGASGALNATTASGGLIKSTLVYNLPAPIWVDAAHVTNFAQLTNPVAFLTGGSDFLISPASANTTYYNQTAKAAKASLNGAGHNVVQNTGGGYKGYTTAWFKYTLEGDTTARAAFVGSPPELNTNSAWSNQAEKNLP